MEAIASLPFIKAFDRLPTRAGVFGRMTDRQLEESEQALLITRQAQALKRIFWSVKERLKQAGGARSPAVPLNAGDYSNRVSGVEEVLRDYATEYQLPSFKWRVLSRRLVGVLEPFWSHRTINVAYADPPTTQGRCSDKKDAGDWDLSSSYTGDPGRPDLELEAWLYAAEDYLALISVSRLNLVFAYLWSLIEFLVIGSLALLLSITSYPFQPQGLMLATIGVTIAVLLILVTSIVIQISRNELVSRIQKTPPNQITFDRQLLGSLLQYVLPLLLALGALSVPLSDVVRSLLEPLFR